MSTINQEKETIKQQVMTFLSKNEQFNRRYPTTPIEVAWHSEGIRSEFSAEFEAWRMQCIQQAGLTIQQDVVVEASVAACELMLPGWSNNVRGVPNSILRGALFGVVKRGNRRYLKGERLASLSNINVIYTGERLDQSDLDVWEGGLHFARKFPLGNRVEFTDKEFLRTIDRSTGKTDREWLLSVARRLSSNTVELKLNRYTYGGSLLDEFYRDEKTGRYALILNPKMVGLFDSDQWTAVDWSVRSSLIGHPLAQWLHSFYSTHAQPIPYSVSKLYELCGSEMRHLYHFRAEIKDALLCVKQKCAVFLQEFNYEIDNNDLVHISKEVTKSQQRHIKKNGIAPMLGGDSTDVGGDSTDVRGG